MTTKATRKLATFANPQPARDYRIHLQIPEFTCLCPLTGQPDFATLVLDYIPDQTCLELKALKLYIWSYRNEGAFHEAVTNRILDDLVAATPGLRQDAFHLDGRWFPPRPVAGAGGTLSCTASDAYVTRVVDFDGPTVTAWHCTVTKCEPWRIDLRAAMKNELPIAPSNVKHVQALEMGGKLGVSQHTPAGEPAGWLFELVLPTDNLNAP